MLIDIFLLEFRDNITNPNHVKYGSSLDCAPHGIHHYTKVFIGLFPFSWFLELVALKHIVMGPFSPFVYSLSDNIFNVFAIEATCRFPNVLIYYS